MFKRILALTLVILMAFCVLAGCKKTADKDAEKNDDNVATTAGNSGDVAQVDILETLPEADLGGRTFMMLTLKNYNASHFFMHHEDDGDPITAVSVERTFFVEEKYNTTLEIKEDAGVVTLLQNNHMSGTNEFDLVFPHPTGGIVGLMTGGYLANWMELDNVTMEGEWYNQSQIESYQVNGKLYVLVSDYAIVAQGISALVYNKNLYTDLNIQENLYELVKNGGWTWEKFLETMKGCGVNADGEGTYGIAFNDGYLNALTNAQGEGEVLVRNQDGEFELGYNADRLTRIAENALALFENKRITIHDNYVNATFPTGEVWGTFKAGNSLFVTFDVGGSYNLLRDLTFNFGILPYPKLDAEQTQHYVGCASGLFAIPSASTTQEESAVIMEALSRYSCKEMKPEFFDTVLLGRMADFTDDYEMLEMIHSLKRYNFGRTIDAETNYAYGVIKTCVDAGTTNVQGYLRQKKNQINSLLELANNLE